MRSEEKQTRLLNKLNNEFGKSILSYLSNPDVLEIIVNPDNKLWIKHYSRGYVNTSESLCSDTAYQLICTVAHHQGITANEDHPIIETELPYLNYRFSGVLPPVVTSASFIIRKQTDVIYTLDSFLKTHLLNQAQVKSIRDSIKQNDSIIIAGAPGTGKTTLANAILSEMCQLSNPNDRFLVLEDTRELQCTAPNTLNLKTTKHISHNDLLKATLRFSPDRIIIGECRGSEMYTLLKAWNTGAKGGIATIHANNASATLIKINDLAHESGFPISPYLICESIDLVVVMDFDEKHSRKVNEIVKVIGFKDGNYELRQC
jgi:type IV secretion system protein VirB11